MGTKNMRNIFLQQFLSVFCIKFELLKFEQEKSLKIGSAPLVFIAVTAVTL
jgi:hypothetical protein